MPTEISPNSTVLGDRYPPINEFIVYINGVEIPASEVSVHYGIWQIPEATIVLPPAVDLIGIGREDRLSAAIFYLDQFYSKDGVRIEEPTYRLLFDGEVTGSAYQVTGTMRTITLTAVAHMGIFTQMFPFFIRSLDDMVREQTGNTADRLRFADNPIVSQLWYQGLNNNAGSLIKRPFDFIENLFQAILGPGQAGLRANAAQDFFAKWTRQHNFHNRWVPCPLLETWDLTEQDTGVFPILKAVQANEALNALQNRSMRIGNEGSIWDVIQGIFSTVYYEVLQLPAPPAVTVELGSGIILGEPQWADDEAASPYVETGFPFSHTDTEDAKFKNFVPRKISSAQNEPLNPLQPVRIASNLTKPQLPFTVPPLCNVIFPSQTLSKSYRENYATQPTRIYISDPSLIQRLQMSNLNPMTHIALFKTQVAFPREANEASKAAVDKKGGNPFDTLIWPEEYFKGPVIRKTVYPEWFTLLNEAYAQASGLVESIPSLTSRPLYELYAANEFYRERLSQQQGNVTMTFDPYVVPGFPGVFLDSDHPALHFFGYITNVQHRMSQTVSSTSVTYAFGQYFQDFFKTLWEAKYDLVNSQALQDKAVLDELGEDLGTSAAALPQVVAEKIKVLGQAIQAIRAQVDALSKERGELITEEEAEEMIASKWGESRKDAMRRAIESTNEEILARQRKAAALLLELSKIEEELKELPSGEETLKIFTRVLNTVESAIISFDHAPVNPFPSIRNRFQNTESAEGVFGNLLHGEPLLEGPLPPSGERFQKPVAFSWRKHLRVSPANRKVEDPPELIELAPEKEDSNVFERGFEQPSFTVAGSLRSASTSMEAALRLKSRPACTLEEYISFHGDLGVREGKVDITDDKEGKGAYYYKQIFKYTYFDEDTEDEQATQEKTEAHIRQNWTTRLLRFREKLINRELDN